MKMPNVIKRILHRASITGLNPRWFVSQYRVTLVQEGGLPFVKLRIDTVKKARAIASRCFEAYGQTDRKQLGVIMLTNHLKQFFENYKVTQIVTSRINEYVETRLEEEAANATINRELAALKRMLKMGTKQTPPLVDRVPYITMLRENNIRKGFFEHKDFIKLRETLPEYLRDFITFGYKTGWRISEIQNLTWNQVDMALGIVRLEVGESKNDEGRTVYLDEELKAVFNRQWERRKRQRKVCSYVFPNRDRTDRMIDIRSAWYAACKEAGIGRRLFHDFRRTAVRNMVRAGIPERVAMMISGHKTRSVFDRYNIVSDQDLKMAAARHATYLDSLHGHNLGTISKFPEKKELTR
jgi:integrase